MASILDAPYDEFYGIWIQTANRRTTGGFRTLEENIEYICRELKAPVSDAQVNRAKQLRFNFIERALVPKTDSLQVLSDLKSECYLTGLVSNCSTEASIIWPKTPFARLIDVAIFSSTAGLQKPDPRIYQLAIGQLSVKPEICLYVGDGDSHELSGAAEVGLHPVLVRDSNKDNSDAMRNDAEIDKWDGPVISSLTEIIKLLK